MVHLFQSTEGGIYDPEMGEFISDVHVHLAAIIHDYKPTLWLVHIPKKAQTGFEKPWAIIERDPRFDEHVIRYLSDEEMRNPRAILAWLFAGDQDKQGAQAILERLEKEALAQQLLDNKAKQEQLADELDHIEFYTSGGRNHLHTIQYAKGVKVPRG